MEQQNQAKNDKNMAKEDRRLLNTRIEEKDNEIHQLSLCQEDMTNFLNDANQEAINLIIENETLRNDIRIEKKPMKE